MKLNFAQDIASKLGISKATQNEAVGDQSVRDAALAARKGGWRVQTEKPTGYARSIRRARHRAADTADRKARRRAARTQRQHDDVTETAGMLALIYFGKVEASERTYDMVWDRVDAQVEEIAAAEGISSTKARQRVELALEDSAERLEAKQAQRAEVKKRRASQKLMEREVQEVHAYLDAQDRQARRVGAAQ